MSSPELNLLLELTLEPARASARAVVEQTMSNANTVEERLVALRAIISFANEIISIIEAIQLEAEQEAHVNVGGEVH